VLSFRLEKRLRAGRRSFELEVGRDIADGCFLGVRGPSGSGKTTLLRCLAGLERPDSGRVAAGAETWYDSASGVFAPPRRRAVGFVPQDYALFPNMTVLGNVLYADRDIAWARELLSLVRLEAQAGHFPRELSGGQKQRTALARALARRPSLLLLDEPLSALDEELREELGSELRRIQRASGVTAIMVSHSRAETSRLCDEVIELDRGRIIDSRTSVR
jgi:molybdate transport system ATP-binding protein